MDYHQNARTTVWSREQMARQVLEHGWTLARAAACANVSARTAAKWVGRFRAGGVAGLRDRSSRPRRLRRPTPAEQQTRVESLRRLGLSGLAVALETGLSTATVSRILRRARLSRKRDLAPPAEPNRYEHKAPGDLLHLDIKKLGRFRAPGHRVTGNPADRTRGSGWEYLHVAIDDHSRIAFTMMLENEQAGSVGSFLIQALRYYAQLGIRVRRILTDNGPAYRSRRFNRLCRRLGLRHRYTRPYTPRTNGKAERFIKTALAEWAYARPYRNSRERAEQLPRWMFRYNHHRPHGGIGNNTPISRAGQNRNNLLTMHK
jgi:transposase InsO family protein